MQYIVTQCNILQLNATYCQTIPHIATECHILPLNATYCQPMSHIATQYLILLISDTHCHTMPHNATYYHPMPHNATCMIYDVTVCNETMQRSTSSHGAYSDMSTVRIRVPV